MESSIQENVQIDVCYSCVPKKGNERDLALRCSSSCLLDSEGYISLGNILATYEAPINEEHAWALCYLSAKCLETHSLSSSTSSHGCIRYIKLIPDCMGLIKVCHQDGQVALDVDMLIGKDLDSIGFQRDSPAERKLLTKPKLISMIGLTIYKALDFGIKDDEERSLSSELANILDKMVSSVDGNEEEEEWCVQNHQQFITKDIIMTCLMHFKNNELTSDECADEFYQQISKNLALDALEFSKLICVTERASKRLKCLCCEDLPRHKLAEEFAAKCTPSVREDLKTVAKIWIHVVRELRRGVNLRRLDDSVVFNRRHGEYEKTPYELLMDDIKSQKYKLRKISTNEEIGRKTKEKLDLHDIIMDYIRSRPTLRKASDRTLCPIVAKQTDPYEELLKSIRQVHHLRPVAARGTT